MRIILTGGERNDITGSNRCSAAFVSASCSRTRLMTDSAPCTPLQRPAPSLVRRRICTTDRHPFDATLYKERDVIERFFSRIKHSRRVATRYDKLARSFLFLVAAIRWPR
jgi:transposase